MQYYFIGEGNRGNFNKINQSVWNLAHVGAGPNWELKGVHFTFGLYSRFSNSNTQNLAHKRNKTFLCAGKKVLILLQVTFLKLFNYTFIHFSLLLFSLIIERVCDPFIILLPAS